MDFRQRRFEPSRHLTGIMLVLLFHVALIYALLSGLAKRVVDVVRSPLETEIIEEPKKPLPPLPELALPPPPLLAPPPPPFIPPPEIRLRQPPPPPPIVAVQPAPPPAPIVIAPVPAPAPPAPVAAPPAPPAPPPPPPPAPAPPAPKPAPAPVSAGVACSNYREVVSEAVYPRQARRLGIPGGDVLMQFTLTANGQIRDIKALRATHRVFAQASARVIGSFKCLGQGRDVIVTVPFSYKLE